MYVEDWQTKPTETNFIGAESRAENGGGSDIPLAPALSKLLAPAAFTEHENSGARDSGPGYRQPRHHRQGPHYMDP